MLSKIMPKNGIRTPQKNNRPLRQRNTQDATVLQDATMLLGTFTN